MPTTTTTTTTTKPSHSHCVAKVAAAAAKEQRKMIPPLLEEQEEEVNEFTKPATQQKFPLRKSNHLPQVVEVATAAIRSHQLDDISPQNRCKIVQTTTTTSVTLSTKRPQQQSIVVRRFSTLLLPLTLHLLLLSTALVNCQVTSDEQPLATATATTAVAVNGSTSEPTTTTSVAPESLATGAEAINNSSGNINNPVNKLKPVNFTLVDEIFDAVLSEEEVVKRWRFMDSQLQDGMKSILKMLFPQIVSISQDAKVSGDCSGGILKWILSLRNLRSWAIKMLDATGKPTAGIFQGSLTMFGNYRQCLSIRAPDEDEIEITDQFEEYFRGQFCVIHLKPWMPIKRPFYHLNSSIESLVRKNYKYYEKTLYDELAEIAIAFNFVDIRMDLCVPSTCTVADIQRVAELLSKKLEMRAKVMRCDIASRDTNPLLSSIDRVSLYWIALPLALILLSIFSTVLLTLTTSTSRRRQVTSGNQTAATNSSFQDSDHEPKLVDVLLQCLSLSRALQNRLTMPNISSAGEESGLDHHLNDEQTTSIDHTNAHFKPLPLYGLRNVFIFWFIVVQMTVELKYQYLRESLILRDMIISYWPFQIIVNSTLLFESIILITAFTYSYTNLESTLKDLIGYIVDKYIRLILSVISLIALTIITPVLAIESPVWRNTVEDQSNVCKSTGYINLFFLQNFISYDKICLPHTWIFCVELQLIILSIPLILLLKKVFISTEDAIIIGKSDQENCGEGERCNSTSRSTCLLKTTLLEFLRTKVGLLVAIITFTGFFINFFTVYTNQLPASWFYTFPDVAQKNYYFGQYLTKTWTHLSVFLIGLIAGHLCRSTLQLRNINLLKSTQQQQQQPSPVPSNSTANLAASSRQGSTSTIMAMEIGSQTDSSSSSQVTCRQAKKQRQLLRLSFQLAATVCMSAIIFSTYSWSTKEAPSTLVAATYDSISRLLWSLALVGIMIQLCLPDSDSGRFSSAARLLSHPICIFFGRLSFLAYLISPYIHTFVLAVEEQSLFPSLFIIFHVIVGNIVITYTVAFILSIVIEQPLRCLVSRFIIGKRLCKQKVNISIYYTNNSLSSLPTMPSKA